MRQASKASFESVDYSCPNGNSSEEMKIPNPLTVIGKLISGTAAGTLQEIDERDVLKGLSEDAFAGIAETYEIVIPEIVIPEIRVRFDRRKKPE